MTKSHSKLKLLNGNHFSIYRHSDLDIDLSDPKSNMKQGLVMSMQYMKFHDHIQSKVKLFNRNNFSIFSHSDLDLDLNVPKSNTK